MILEKVKLLGKNSPKVDLNIVFTSLLLSYIKAYSSAAAAFCACGTSIVTVCWSVVTICLSQAKSSLSDKWLRSLQIQL